MQPVLHGLALWVLANGIAMSFLFVVSFPVHRSEYGWTDGCESAKPEAQDFGEHIVQTTQDYSTSIQSLWFRLLLAGSFNDHITHHLFPTLDLSKQHLVRPIVIQGLKEFHVGFLHVADFSAFVQIDYEQHSFGDLLYSTLVLPFKRWKGDFMCYVPPKKAT